MALDARQKRDGCSNGILNFIRKVLHPSRFVGRAEEFEGFRSSVNSSLLFLGVEIRDDGELREVKKAETVGEAERRASALQSKLRRRFVHADVLAFCRPELLNLNYFHCVLEATKSIAQKIRDKTGLDGDGVVLVQKAFSVRDPLLALNSLQTETERTEQTGFSNFLSGLFGMFRNVTAHAPRRSWIVDEDEAMAALAILSYGHRRLDEATVVRRK